LDAIRHGIEQGAEVAGPGLQPGRREEVDRVVERRVDLLAGGKTVLGDAHQLSGVLQCQQILSDACRKNDLTHERNPFCLAESASALGDNLLVTLMPGKKAPKNRLTLNDRP